MLSWGLLGTLWGTFGAVLGCSWDSLGLFWGSGGALDRDPHCTFRGLGSFFCFLGRSGCCRGVFLGRSGALVGLSWGVASGIDSILYRYHPPSGEDVVEQLQGFPRWFANDQR